MHGQGSTWWPDGKKYKGVIILFILSNIEMIRNMEEEYLNGPTEVNILELG